MKAKAYAKKETTKLAVNTIREDKVSGFLAYETDRKQANGLPNLMVQWTDASPTAQACLEKINEFVIADGFKDRNSSAFLVNQAEETATEMVAELVQYQSIFNAFAIKVGHSLNNKVGDAETIPFEWVRKAIDYDESKIFVVNEKMGVTGYNKADNVTMAAYKANKTNTERSKSIGNGELLYSYTKAPGQFKRVYPLPGYYSGIGYLHGDALLDKIEWENAEAGYMPPVILSTIPEPDNTIQDKPSGKTEMDRMSDNVKKFIGVDVDKRARILHLFANSQDELNDLKTFGDEIQRGILGDATERIMVRICMMFGVPPVLIGKSTPGKQGENQELINQMKLFQRSVKKRQMKITQAFGKIWPDMDWTMTKLDIIKFIPPQVFEHLTINEIRQIADFEPVENGDNIQHNGADNR